MYIEKISIASFGSISERTYELTDGVNIVCGENESGKSTIAAFIKFVLYGMSGKTQDESMTEKSRYTSWSTGISSGSLVINDDGKRYRVERELLPAAKASGKETVKIIDLESGRELHSTRSPGEFFFGVGEDLFRQTAFSAQGSQNSINTAGVNNAINNILFSADESVSVKTALKKLDEARVYLLHKNKKGGRIFAIENEISELKTKIKDSEAINSSLSERNQSLEKYLGDLENCRRQLAFYEDASERIEAEATLKKLSALDDAAERSSEAHDKYLRLVEKYGHDGFLPDENYSAMLKEAESRILMAENDLKNAVRRRDDLPIAKPDAQQEEIHSLTEKQGGRESAVKKIFSCFSKKAKYKKLLTVFSVLSALFAVAGIVSLAVGIQELSSGGIVLPASMFVLSAGFLICSAVFMSRYSSEKSGLEYMLAALKSDSLTEAVRRIENVEEIFAAYEKSKIALSRLDSDITRLRAALDSTLENASSLLARWGVDCREETAQSIKLKLQKATEAATQAASEIRLSERNSEAANSKYEALSISCAGYDRDKCLKTLEKTKYTESEGKTSEEILRNLSFLKNQEKALEAKIQTLKLEIATLSAHAQDTHAMTEKLSELTALKSELSEKHNALYLAHEVLIRASESLREKIAPTLTKEASEMISKATGEKFAGVYVDSDLNLSFRDSDASLTRAVGFMSEGTKALSYISLRLALIGLLFKSGKKPCIVFDESFVYLDDFRLKNAMSLLYNYGKGEGENGDGGQVIILTCSDRESNAFADMYKVNEINI